MLGVAGCGRELGHRRLDVELELHELERVLGDRP
jgi:hypothetical protein